MIALDAGITAQNELRLAVFTDSDWARCLGTRPSTDSFVAVLGGAIVQIATQTQPGLPATSSSNAEIRGASRGAREAIFLRDLGKLDFGLKIAKPNSGPTLWQPCRQHLGVSEFDIQGALQAKKVGIGKAKGLWNPANFHTKHPKTGTDVGAALPFLGVLEHDGGYRRATIKVAEVSKQLKNRSRSCLLQNL